MIRQFTIRVEDDQILIDGARVSIAMIPEILHVLAHPDPRKWYNFNRLDDIVVANVRIEYDGGPPMKCVKCGFRTQWRSYVHCPYDGNILNTAPEDDYGRRSSSEATRSQGEEAADARDAHPQNS